MADVVDLNDPDVAWLMRFVDQIEEAIIGPKYNFDGAGPDIFIEGLYRGLTLGTREPVEASVLKANLERGLSKVRAMSEKQLQEEVQAALDAMGETMAGPTQ